MAPYTENSAAALEAMPQFRRNDLSRFVLGFVDMVFSRPGEEEKYQEWLKARKGKNADTQCEKSGSGSGNR